MIGEKEKELFRRLCAAESYAIRGLSVEEGIGIYNEKRLHRILKRVLCERESCYEAKVGRYTADVLCDGHIYEIQCAALAPLKDKLAYYLESTDYSVTVVHPIIVKRTIIRAERETGDIAYTRRSPKKEHPEDVLPLLYHLRLFIPDPRFSLLLVLVEVEEYRYSEAVRHRRTGKYDSEVFPVALVEAIELNEISDYVEFLPKELIGKEFSAADYKPYTSLRGRDVYSALNTLADIGIIERIKDGRRVRYKA